MIKLGLIGFPLGHSFSKNFYLEKFNKENISGVDYDLYPIENIESFNEIFEQDTNFKGFNVTLPHKENVISLLDELSEEAKEIKAVNCITINNIHGKPYLTGYNTDAFGFENSFKPMLNENHTKALILGNGGAAKAVLYTLKKLNIPYTIVSRSLSNGDITYDQLTEEIIKSHRIIINCTPIGTFPNVDKCPNIPYQFIGNNHFCYDLIYNPAKTLFLEKAENNGAIIKNGHEMLVLQAEKNWEIWQQNF